MKKSVCFGTAAAIGILATSSAWAGDRIGNGGVGVVCRDPKGNLLSVEMLDIFEGKNLDESPLQYAGNGLDMDTRIQLATVQMVGNAKFLQDFQTELARVKANIVILKDASIGLEPTNDAFPVIHRKGCEFVQVANYMDDGKIRVDRELYQRMDTLNRAALYVHETIYSVARTNVGETNSIRSRKLTAQVLAKNPDAGVARELMAQLTPPPAPVEPPKSMFDQFIAGVYVSETKGFADTRVSKYEGGILVTTQTSHTLTYQCNSAGECRATKVPEGACESMTISILSNTAYTIHNRCTGRYYENRLR